MLELLALGTIWFWLLLFAVSVVVTVLVEAEQGFWATLTLIGTVVTLNYALKLPIFKAVLVHPWQTAAWIVVYFLAGAAWGLFKWYVYLHKRLARYRDVRDQFLKEKGATELTSALAFELQKRLNEGYVWKHGDYYNRKEISSTPPAASEHKGDIIRWMTYWPFSIVGTILNDFVRKAWTHIYNFMVETYDRMAAHVFRNYTADAALAKQGAAEAIAAQEKEDSPRRRNSY